MDSTVYRIEVFHKSEDHRGKALAHKLQNLHYSVQNVIISDNYLVNADLTEADIEQAAQSLSQPVTQNYLINKAFIPEQFDFAIEIGFLPGVTDNVSHTVREAVEDLLKINLDHEKSVFSSKTYFISGTINREQAEELTLELCNPLIERMTILSHDEYISQGGMGAVLPIVKISDTVNADEVDLNVSDDELITLGKEGIADKDGKRRGPLALDLDSMKVIKDYFIVREQRNPTDIEMESIAQTWSEHCKHTIFAAEIDDNSDGIYKRYIKEATIRVRREKGDKDFCLSVFEDNSGGIEFDDNYIVSDKVETHNSPSALDPFGGSITGIVGVNRDAIGFGMAAKPVANRYGFCFADPGDKKPLYRTKEENSQLLPPRRIMEGVIHGVNVGGNTSGIPTPQGFVYFDERYKGKPLVFVGTLGLLPKVVNNKSSVTKKAMPGDHVVMIGGRVGRDGIHGATFSSEALSSGSPATAVQIGDPITQKKLSDAIAKEARDLGLYNSITDNGAGGLSCSVAEMAKESGGFEVDLEKIPLKYPGLSPWQIWVSESQERMTLAIPDESLQPFLGLMKKRGVEASVLGTFTGKDRGIVRHNGKIIYDLDMTFLHDGLPKKKLRTIYTKQDNAYPAFDVPASLDTVYTDMISRLNTASFQFISTQYDHEVQANSIVKPLQGKGKVNGNASVIRPLLDSPKCVVLSQGLYPSYSEIDTYQMAASSIDTAVRNAVSVGGSIDNLAILDNFCWTDSNNSERLGQLKAAAEACYDYAVAYGTPFISGKDSMFNDFRGYDDEFEQVMISIPPTLLISSIGVIDSVDNCQTIDFKFENDLIYILGITKDEIGGSEYLAYMGESIDGKKYIGNNVPRVNASDNIKLYRKFEKAISEQLIASSISLEIGGLGVALAKSAIAGQLGCSIDLAKVPVQNVSRDDVLLYSESQGRLLVSIHSSNKEKFEQVLGDVPFACIGSVNNNGTVVIEGLSAATIIEQSVENLTTEYNKRFRDY